MRKLIAVALTLGLSVTLLGASSSEARSKNYLSVKGHVVAAVDHAPAGALLAFEYSVKNTSKRTTAELAVEFSSNAGQPTDYICTSIATGRDISPDTPACEIGLLKPRKTGHVGVIYTMPEAGDLVVNACASDIAGATPGNGGSCKKLTVHEDR